MDKTNTNNNFAVLSLVAIVAIIAVICLVMIVHSNFKDDDFSSSYGVGGQAVRVAGDNSLKIGNNDITAFCYCTSGSDVLYAGSYSGATLSNAINCRSLCIDLGFDFHTFGTIQY